MAPRTKTPGQSYPDPYWPAGNRGPTWANPSALMGTSEGNIPASGAMANTPTPGWGYTSEERGLTPTVNQAAMRGYTRNAPYMANLVDDPDSMRGEIYNLYKNLETDPSDVVSQYRLRILNQALQDIYNLQPVGNAFSALATPTSQTETPYDISSYMGRHTTPRPIAENMAKRGK